MDRQKDKPLAKEQYGTSVQRTYTVDPRNEEIIVTAAGTARWISFTNFFMTVFLPHGYPDTVSNDYMRYQVWDSVQAFASSITGSICTHAVLKGVGVGDASASTLAATVSWLIRDGTSMLGRILFSWIQGTKLDSDCKKWRLFADIMNDIAMFLDLMTPHFKEHFLLIVCASGVMKSVVGVAGGATRASITQHQARKNNMADVSAKDGSQETLVNLTALVCSLLIIPSIVESPLLIWTTYIFMTCIHILANYLAVKSVTMETFNEPRFRIYTDHYLNSGMQSNLSVPEVNARENVLIMPFKEACKITLGTSFSEAIASKSSRAVDNLIAIYEKCDYFLTFSKLSKRRAKICVCFRSSPHSLTLLEAMFQSCILYNTHTIPSNPQSENFFRMYNIAAEQYSGFESEVLPEVISRKFTKENFHEFKRRTEMIGWRLDAVVFNVDLWRVMW